MVMIFFQLLKFKNIISKKKKKTYQRPCTHFLLIALNKKRYRGLDFLSKGEGRFLN